MPPAHPKSSFPDAPSMVSMFEKPEIWEVRKSRETRVSYLSEKSTSVPNSCINSDGESEGSKASRRSIKSARRSQKSIDHIPVVGGLKRNDPASAARDGDRRTPKSVFRGLDENCGLRIELESDEHFDDKDEELEDSSELSLLNPNGNEDSPAERKEDYINTGRRNKDDEQGSSDASEFHRSREEPRSYEEVLSECNEYNTTHHQAIKEDLRQLCGSSLNWHLNKNKNMLQGTWIEGDEKPYRDMHMMELELLWSDEELAELEVPKFDPGPFQNYLTADPPTGLSVGALMLLIAGFLELRHQFKCAFDEMMLYQDADENRAFARLQHFPPPDWPVLQYKYIAVGDETFFCENYEEFSQQVVVTTPEFVKTIQAFCEDAGSAHIQRPKISYCCVETELRQYFPDAQRTKSKPILRLNIHCSSFKRMENLILCIVDECSSIGHHHGGHEIKHVVNRFRHKSHADFTGYRSINLTIDVSENNEVHTCEIQVHHNAVKSELVTQRRLYSWLFRYFDCQNSMLRIDERVRFLQRLMKEPTEDERRNFKLFSVQKTFLKYCEKKGVLRLHRSPEQKKHDMGHNMKMILEHADIIGRGVTSENMIQLTLLYELAHVTGCHSLALIAEERKMQILSQKTLIPPDIDFPSEKEERRYSRTISVEKSYVLIMRASRERIKVSLVKLQQSKIKLRRDENEGEKYEKKWQKKINTSIKPLRGFIKRIFGNNSSSRKF